jgi:anti-sigma factor RsiW
MACNESLTTQSLFDGALDGEAAREAERHVAGCADCRRQIEALESIRAGLRTPSTYQAADTALRERISAALDLETTNVVPLRRQRRGFWLGAMNGSLVTAAAAAAAFFFLLSPQMSEMNELLDGVASAHIRSQVGNHLVDVATADPATAGVWMKSHGGLSFAAMVPAGYQLVGAREDYLYGANADALVYRVGHHVVNVFAWATDDDDDMPASASANGYNIVFWKRGKVVFCAISNLPVAELEKIKIV